jgi:hypothetical protein
LAPLPAAGRAGRAPPMAASQRFDGTNEPTHQQVPEREQS